VAAGRGADTARYLTAHVAAYDTLSMTWGFWNSKFNSKCNDTQLGRDYGLCGRSWSVDEQVVTAAAKQLGMRVVPILEVCCVCVLNASYDYQPGMAALVADAKRQNFDGFVLDMVCGGHDEPQRAAFLDALKQAFQPQRGHDEQQQQQQQQQQRGEVSWFSHGFYHPELTFPNTADFLYDMDTYSHPTYAPAWVGSYQCQAGVGLEYPAYNKPEQVAEMFSMLNNLSHLRAIGTYIVLDLARRRNRRIESFFLDDDSIKILENISRF